MPSRWMPGVVGIWLRYMAPNLPAPIRPMRSGFAEAARSSSMRCRFIVSSRCFLDYSAAAWRRATRATASSSQASIGVKSRCAMYSGRLKRRMAFCTEL